MKRLLGLSILFFPSLYCAEIVAQCSIGDCVGIDCGDLNASFMPDGGPVFCDGEVITLNNTSDAGFDFFVVDWGGGNIDTMDNYSAFTNAFDVSEDELCEGSTTTTFSICFVGYKSCEAGFSCQSGTLAFGIKKRPLATIIADNQICITEISPFTNASCNGETYFWDFGDGETSDLETPDHQYDMPGTYTVTLMVTNTCGTDTDTHTITVVEEPVAAFSTTNDPPGCAPFTIGFNDESNANSGTVWQVSPNDTTQWCFADTTMNLGTDDITLIFKFPGIYTVTQFATTACGTVDSLLEIEVLEEATININPPPAACNSITVTEADLGLTTQGPVNSISWKIITNGMVTNINSPNFPTTTFDQTSTICALADAACGDILDSVTVEVIPIEEIMLAPENPSQLCQGGPPVQLQASPPEGSWSPTGSISPDGTVDPSMLSTGPQTFIYTIGEDTPCETSESVTIEIIPSAIATITPVIFCEDSGSSQLMVDLPGGVWQGPGIIDSIQGIFDPAVTGVDTVTITYFLEGDSNGCPVQTTVEIPVEPFPELMLQDTITLCLVDAEIDLAAEFNYQASPSGGISTWSGTNISPTGLFNSQVPTPLTTGIYTATVSYERNACIVTDSAYIDLIDQPVLELTRDSTVCIDEIEITLLANLSGGEWDGEGIDPQTGVITLEDAGDGIFTYTYIFEPHPSCSQSASVMVEIIDPAENLTAGNDVELCEEEVNTYLLTQEQNPMPIGGFWSGTGITDPLVGAVNVSQLVLDSTYVFSYCVEEAASANDCSACTSINFIVHSNPEAAFAFDGTPCIGEVFTMINNTTNTESTTEYFWDFGDGENSMLFEPTHTYDNQDTYTLSLTATTTYATATCTDIAQQELFITTPPVAEFDLTETEGCAPFSVEVASNTSSGFDISQQWCVAGDTILGSELGSIILDSITTDSVFNIELKVTNLCGTVIDTEQVLVHPYPIVRLGMDVDEGCSPLTVEFANPSQGNPDYYNWDMGNSFMYTDSLPPDQIYTTPEDSISVYYVTLLAGNECGEREVTDTITVYPPDVEAFIALDTLSGCQPFTVQPESFSTPGANVAWEVVSPSGAELSSNEQAPIFELTEAGTYTFYLFAQGCGEHLDSATIDVLPAPQVSFTSPDYVCLGDTLFFTNTSDNISGVVWDFDNETFSDVYDAFVVYDSMGTYTVTLTAFSTLNQCPASFSKEIEVIGNPTASFTTSDLSGCAPLTVDFTDNSSGQTPLEYTWTFDDGEAAFEPNPSHDFMNPGTYTVVLTVRDEFGCSADTSVVNVIVHDDPVADFTFPDEPYCHRYDSLFLESLAIDAVSFEWQIGDSTYTAENPRILPPNAGVYDIVLTVENTFGCQASTSHEIEILPSPTAMFSSDTNMGCEDLLVNFTNESEAGDSYVWDFANGNSAVDLHASHLFRDPGTYTVELTVSNSNGCPDDEAMSDITVHPEPTANFEFDQPQYCGAPATITFTNNSLLNTANNWRFGDAGTSDETMPTFTFVDFGNYEIELIVSTPFGCQDTIAKLLDVYGNPLAGFDVPATDICDGDSITFLNTSLESIAYRWEIEGIGVLTEMNPTVLFPGPGSYDIKLVAIYNDICQDSLVLDNYITVHEQPLAAFTFLPNTTDTLKGEVQFVNLSQNAERFYWDLGDGTTTTEFAPFHEYFQNRFIEVNLFAYHDNGGLFTCVDSTSLEVSPEWLKEFWAPNAMSPEYGSDLVRVFRPVGIGLKDYTLQIFSPLNEQVWYTDALLDTAPAESWDGYYKGELVPQGSYTWIARIEYEDGSRSVRKGSVTVLR